MTKPSRASIVIYDEDAGQLKLFNVFRKDVQSIIERELARSGGVTIPPTAIEHGNEPITDEDARKLGCIAILMQASVHTDLRDRLAITTSEPVDWKPVQRPDGV
ncbi:hypothetical protein [Caballeronia sp. TF1N1]|uniref:hypothetical protein n=1 Tax=Caballeronia sp. TF1N1 TaxID=2878153 RepID=UPI001FD4A160|nr:hypothetical protein [Caballeronia sp. TF1N1]